MLIPLIAAAIAVAPMTPPDDLDIIGVEMVELVLASDVATPLCGAYGDLVGAIDGLGMSYSDGAVLMEAADAYLIITMEGDSMRFDNEARAEIIDWLHTDCS